MELARTGSVGVTQLNKARGIRRDVLFSVAYPHSRANGKSLELFVMNA